METNGNPAPQFLMEETVLRSSASTNGINDPDNPIAESRSLKDDAISTNRQTFCALDQAESIETQDYGSISTVNLSEQREREQSAEILWSHERDGPLRKESAGKKADMLERMESMDDISEISESELSDTTLEKCRAYDACRWISPCNSALEISKQIISISQTRMIDQEHQRLATYIRRKGVGQDQPPVATTPVNNIRQLLRDPFAAAAVLGKRAASKKFGYPPDKSDDESDSSVNTINTGDVVLNVELDSFATFTANSSDRYLALRKIYLKTDELCQYMGTRMDLGHGEARKYTNIADTPPLTFWFITLLRMMHGVTIKSSNSAFVDGKILREYNSEIRCSLKVISKELLSLEKQITKYYKHFDKFKRDFSDRVSKISKKISYYCRPEMIDEWKDSFKKLKDEAIAKGTYVLSPIPSSTDYDQDLGTPECLVHDAIGDIIYYKTSENVDDRELQHFFETANIYRIEIVSKFLLKLHTHVQQLCKMASTASTEFTTRKRFKWCHKSISDLEEKLTEMEQTINKGVLLWFPPQISRCLFQFWQSKTMLNNIESILLPIKEFVSTFIQVWNGVFGKMSKFTFEGFNSDFKRRMKKIPFSWTTETRKFAFDLTEDTSSSATDRWNYVVVAPNKFEDCAPLMFQLFTNTLAGLINYDHEYVERIEREFSDPENNYAYHEDIYVCCAHIEHLYRNTGVIATKVRNLLMHMRELDFRRFGRLVSATGDNSLYASNYGHIPTSIVDNGQLLKYWMVLCVKCLEVSSSAAFYNTRVKQLEDCFEMLGQWVTRLKKLYTHITKQFEIMKQVIQFFETERDLFPCLEKLGQVQVRPIMGSVLLADVELLTSYSTSREYMPVTKDIMLVNINDKDIAFSLPDHEVKIAYTVIAQSGTSEEFLETLLATTKDLVSSKLEFLENHDTFLSKFKAGNNGGDSVSLAQLVHEIHQLMKQPNPRQMMCLDVIVAIRSLRLAQAELYHFLNAIYRKVLIYKKMASVGSKTIKNLRKKKPSQFGELISDAVALCYYDIHHAKLVKQYGQLNPESNKQVNEPLCTTTESV